MSAYYLISITLRWLPVKRRSRIVYTNVTNEHESVGRDDVLAYVHRLAAEQPENSALREILYVFGPGEELLEQLAAIEHERWSAWQKYVHAQCTAGDEPGTYVIPAHLFQRWARQIAIPYERLSEAEKSADRREVMRYWPLLVKQLRLTQM
jgi:hypothetical protein